MKRLVCIILLAAASFTLYAQSKADSLIDVLNTRSLTANEQLKLYKYLYDAFVNTNPKDALLYSKKGLALAEKENSKGDMMIFHQTVGYAYIHLGRYDTARYSLNNALDMAVKMGNRKLQSNALMQLGISYAYEGDMVTSQEYLLNALSVCDSASMNETYAAILGCFGDTYRVLGNTNMAIQYLERAKALMEKLNNNHVTLGAIYCELANIYWEQKQFDQALEYGLNAMEKALSKDIKALAGTTAGLLAKVYQTGFNNSDKALEYAMECVHQAEVYGEPYYIKDGLNNLAYIYRKQKRWKECEETTLKVWERDTATTWETKLAALQNLVISSIYLNKKDKAAEFFNQYDSILRAHTEQSYQETLMNMEVKYKTEKKDLEHRMLQQAHDRQSTLLAVLAAALILIVSMSVLLVAFYRKSIVNNRDLKNMHRIKDRLLSMIAHDLRSPVSALISLLELMKTSRFDPAMQTVMINDISNRVNGMYGMIDNLLRWAKSQMQGIAPNPKMFDAQIESRTVTDVLEDIAGKKGIALQNLIAAQQVYADRDMFAVTVQNLTMNAIKYTSAGGTVTLSSELSGGMLVVSVKDTGMGMTPEVQKNLFDLAATQSRRGTANEMGTGLGLSLCADFVKANGGAIRFKSAPGEGSTFSFSIPVRVES